MKSLILSLLVGISSAWAMDVDYGPTQAGTTLSAACIKTPDSDASTFAAGCDGPSVTMKSSTLTVGGNAFSVGTSTLVVANGKVGIGKTSPGYPVHIKGAGSPGLLILEPDDGVSGSSTPITIWGDDLTANRYIQFGRVNEQDNASYQAFYVKTANNGVPAERFRIEASGNVGIGTTSPGYKLMVESGSVAVTSGTLSMSGTGSPTTGGALCLNAANRVVKCTSAVDASGNCTCP